MAEFLIGNKRFASKASAERAVSVVLNTSPVDSYLEGDHKQLLIDLVALHPRAEEKIGPGIADIHLRRNGWGGKGFWIIRTDGTETDFSYIKCFQGKQAQRYTFRSACRYAVLGHVNESRKHFFDSAEKPTCALTGTPITLTQSHVDHTPPYTFDRIYRAFLVLNDIDQNEPTLTLHGDNVTEPLFADNVLRDRWIHFHNTFATLRVISADANVRLLQRYMNRTEKERRENVLAATQTTAI